ncbi:MAG: hypothetical protein II850_04215 [Fibrobacter sp.]|nr:hypothetical protein [Fibrobacter sp.]
MICKKCGREYDDDMPKCLWCDAPNDSKVNSSGTNPADGTDPEETVHLTECEISSKKAQRWLFFFFLSLLTTIAIAWFFSLFFSHLLDNGFLDFFAKWLLLGSIALVAIIGIPVFIIFFLPFFGPPFFSIISFCIAIYKCSKWQFHAEKELNRYSEVKLVPWKDIAGMLILPLFPFTHFFIFRKLFARQKETLGKNNLESATPPRWVLPGILGGGIAVYVSFLLMLCDGSALNHTAVACFIAFSIILFVSYIKTIRAITANTRALNSLTTNDAPRDETSKNTLPQENQ